MRVLMVNRHDASTVSGGDTVQMLETKSALEALGVEVTVGEINQETPLNRYDLLHVFNCEVLHPVLQSIYANGKTDLPIVLSPIFWFHTGHWFDQAASTRRVWGIAARGLGNRRAGILFENWQRLKFTYGKPGQTLRLDLSKTVRLLPNSKTEIAHLEYMLNQKDRLGDRCTVVPNGISRRLYDPIPPQNEDFRREYGLEGFILQVARIQSAKNQLGLIEALAKDDFPIVFVGQPSPYETEYVNRCYEMGKQRGNVFFLSHQTHESLAGIQRLAAVHVLPSWRETPGLASLEAAAAGCRIVSTSIGSAYDYFGDQARYCDPRKSSSIRKAVLEALSSPPPVGLREKILEDYTWDVAGEKTLEAYHLAVK